MKGNLNSPEEQTISQLLRCSTPPMGLLKNFKLDLPQGLTTYVQRIGNRNMYHIFSLPIYFMFYVSMKESCLKNFGRSCFHYFFQAIVTVWSHFCFTPFPCTGLLKVIQNLQCEILTNMCVCIRERVCLYVFIFRNMFSCIHKHMYVKICHIHFQVLGRHFWEFLLML